MHCGYVAGSGVSSGNNSRAEGNEVLAAHNGRSRSEERIHQLRREAESTNVSYSKNDTPAYKDISFVAGHARLFFFIFYFFFRGLDYRYWNCTFENCVRLDWTGRVGMNISRIHAMCRGLCQRPLSFIPADVSTASKFFTPHHHTPLFAIPFSPSPPHRCFLIIHYQRYPFAESRFLGRYCTLSPYWRSRPLTATSRNLVLRLHSAV